MTIILTSVIWISHLNYLHHSIKWIHRFMANGTRSGNFLLKDNLANFVDVTKRILYLKLYENSLIKTLYVLVLLNNLNNMKCSEL